MKPTQRPLLEGLEDRRLLSASLKVTGAGKNISAGDTTPQRIDYTDFGPMSVSGTISQATRTFVITNTGDKTLTFDGDRVKLSGSDANQFKVTRHPPTTIAPGKTATFTVIFDPSSVGEKKASLTITSNASNAKSFTFAIEGNALQPSQLADGLQVAVLKKGHGDAAKKGQVLEINYTGFRQDGSVFDTSMKTGRSPFTFTAEIGRVILGWLRGLKGTRAGDNRVLFIPAALAYGKTGSSDGSIKPNTPLIFETATLRIGGPSIKVSGGLPLTQIPDGDTTPTRTDSTDFGATKKGKTITKKFTVAADLWESQVTVPSFTDQTHPVHVTGANARDFTVGQLVSNGDGTLSFTVTFKPTAAGWRHATISIPNNNPADKDYNFAIQGKGT